MIPIESGEPAKLLKAKRLTRRIGSQILLYRYSSKMHKFALNIYGIYYSRRKAYSVAEQRLPKHIDRQGRSGVYNRVTFFGLCYRLYAVIGYFSLYKPLQSYTDSIPVRITATLWQAEHSAVRRTHFIGTPEPVSLSQTKKQANACF